MGGATTLRPGRTCRRRAWQGRTFFVRGLGVADAEIFWFEGDFTDVRRMVVPFFLTEVERDGIADEAGEDGEAEEENQFEAAESGERPGGDG